jgi:predicted DNA-binding transcriptional regulator AlpA
MPHTLTDSSPEIVDTPWLARNGYGSRWTIYRKIEDGRLPPPDFRDPRPKWFMSTIREHVEMLAEATRGAA